MLVGQGIRGARAGNPTTRACERSRPIWDEAAVSMSDQASTRTMGAFATKKGYGVAVLRLWVFIDQIVTARCVGVVVPVASAYDGQGGLKR